MKKVEYIVRVLMTHKVENKQHYHSFVIKATSTVKAESEAIRKAKVMYEGEWCMFQVNQTLID